MKTFDVPQRSDEWFKLRRGIPTASRFDMIMTAVTCKPSSSQAKLIDQLLAESLLPAETVERSSADMEHGMILEAEARCAYELGYAPDKVTEVGFILSDCGRFGCSPDGLVGDKRGVEIKCPNPSTQVSYVRAGVLPSEYKCQVHGSMIVSGRSEWDFFSYARGLPPLCVTVRADDFTNKLRVEIDAFCMLYNAARAVFELPPLGTHALKGKLETPKELS